MNRMPVWSGNDFSMSDLFANTGHNWNTLTPVISILFGVMFGAFILRSIIKRTRGDDDD